MRRRVRLSAMGKAAPGSGRPVGMWGIRRHDRGGTCACPAIRDFPEPAGFDQGSSTGDCGDAGRSRGGRCDRDYAMEWDGDSGPIRWGDQRQIDDHFHIRPVIRTSRIRRLIHPGDRDMAQVTWA
jgi:hypothetical protein